MGVPVLVDVESVCGVVCPEVLEDAVADVADGAGTAGPGLDHEHLGALVDVDAAHVDVLDFRTAAGSVE